VTRSPLLRSALLGAAVALAAPLAACTSDASDGSSASSGASGSRSSGPTGATSSASAAVPADAPFGSGCNQLPASGPGSVAAMATAPAATAAAGNPLLTSVVDAVTKANLGDTLNTTQNVTIFAPANSAFQAVPADQLAALLGDTAKLTAVLTHHVVAGRLTPAQVAGRLTTLDNDTLTVAGTAQDPAISGDQTLSGQPAKVVCGNLQTANATIYIVNQVLKPQKVG
jgi:uncharacterized surface protein with fasciclin (FAS1) repeats